MNSPRRISSTLFRPKFTLILGGQRVRLGERTLICGIVNVTPDSFWDGGRYFDPKRAIRHALELVEAGADWIDVGGESTRPGAEPVSAAEELARVLPVIEGVRKRAPKLPISIDTTKSEVAEQALRAGASIINDISGLRFDPRIAEVARRSRVPLILMHLRGRPATMQKRPFARSISRSLGRGLGWSVQRALAMGVRRSQLIIDPGLGFGKTRRQNFEIMADLAPLRRLRLPIMAGASHKSFIQAVAAGELLEGEGKGKKGKYWKLRKAGVIQREINNCASVVGSVSGHGFSRAARGQSLAAALAADQGLKPPQNRRSVAARLKPCPDTIHAATLDVPYSSAMTRAYAVPAEELALDFADAAAAAGLALAGAHILRVHNVAATLPAVRIADAILSAAQE